MLETTKITVETIIPFLEDNGGYNGKFLYKGLGNDGETYYYFERWTVSEQRLRERFNQLVNDGVVYLDEGESVY
jgi:hypothetical protein